ncbi:MAG: ParB N-terminal domain-containing protein [Sphingomonas sp.]|uniref:ParB/RepB/Spo0J family partition protein n=1 Tax=Sphingomonas sp. TaxID=28214 RepID=UPI00227459AA|nr:ParB N-terminal domain-containing protein [Sphingomonas sp.]MCX8478000.1 ParB N-terminal domain-containing protein [Sphingomonas sp.]
MKLDFIPIDKLFVDKANMRHGRKAPDISDILPTIRARGVIQPLLVRPADNDRFGIVAGSRRYHASLAVAAERRGEGDPDPEALLLPCGILDAGDDAAAIEASMIENFARLDPDEVSRWESFVRLVKQGKTVEDIAATFGLPDLAVRRVLALGNLLPRIRDLYRREAIDAATVRHLTMASKRQQQAWLALHDDPEAYCPTGHQLKAWLFGGSTIKAAHALFDVEASGAATVADLFGEDKWFADPDAFWTLQNAAIDARRAAYLEAGWSDVVIVPPGQHFQSWEYEKTPKRKGGRVYIVVRASGEVAFHEGYLTRSEVRRRERGEAPESGRKPARPEVSGTMQDYIDLHRHAAVRAALTGFPHVALRLMVAHAVLGSPLWGVRVEPQATRNDAVRESVETCRGETEFDEKRRAVLGVLGFDPERETVVRNRLDDCALVRLFLRLLDLPDPAVMDVIAIVMGETLASGSAAVAAVGEQLGVAMADWWQADPVFLELIRDREVLLRIVAEVAGERVAEANAKEKGRTLKAIVADHLEGANGRARVERWVPGWMAFPATAYTVRGGVGSVRAAALVAAARVEDDEPEPSGPGALLALPAPDSEPEPVPEPLAA